MQRTVFQVARLSFLSGAAVLAAACSQAAPGDGKDGGKDGAGQTTSMLDRTSERAFPGAVGYGSIAKGGRGGRVMVVTSLGDTGPGTLRACIEASGPRVCTFAVAGVIRFLGRPPIIRNPYITIAGQTAPGGGITLAHSGAVGGRTPLVVKGTNDVVIRDIRVRNDRLGEDRKAEDSITIESSRRVIIDHVSASWARDELVNGFADNDYITVSNSIFSWGIPKHDKCALLGSDPKGPQFFSFIGNVCAHSGDRNPDINFPPGSCVEVINNVFYNASSEFIEVWESYGGTPVSLAGNTVVAGPNTSSNAVGIVRQTVGSKGKASIYMAYNEFKGKFTHVTPAAQALVRKTPSCKLTVNPMFAADAYASALKDAGAWPRDALDRQAVSEVRSRTGRIMQAPGTIPAIAPGTAYADADRDGMDDKWEAQNGADPHKADPWADANGDGLSNLDAFLDYRHWEITQPNYKG